MNEVEVIDSDKQLPESIDKLSAFVMVSEEKVQAMRAQIRAIDKVGLAEDVYKQKVAEAQELSKLAIEAAERLGEELLKIPTKMGQRTDLTSVTKVTEVKTKTEITQELGLSHKQVLDYQQMAQNPEAVQKAIDDAIARGDVVSRSQVMKEIDAIKRQLADEQEKTKTLAGIRDKLVVEKAGLKKQIAEGSSDEVDKLTEQLHDLQDQLADAKNDAGEWQASYETVLREMKRMDENPKVVEKIPDDYQTFRARCGEAERKVTIFQREKRKLLDQMDEKTDEIIKLKDQIKALQNPEEKKKPDDIDVAISDFAYSLRIYYSQIGTKIKSYDDFLKDYAEKGSMKNKLELLMLLENLGRRCYEVKSLLQRASGTIGVNNEETIEDVIHDLDSELNTGLRPCDTTK